MRKIFITAILALAAFTSEAQIEKFQALFMYKFVQNLEWPADKVPGNFKIGIVGDDAINTAITNLVKGRTVKGKSIEVASYTPGTTTDGYHLIFISNRNKNIVEATSKKATATSTVIVTESPGFAKKGAAVNFITVGGALKFEMNENTLTSAKVKASGSIKSLAKLIN